MKKENEDMNDGMDFSGISTLNPKWKQVAEEFIRTQNKMRAYMSVYPNSSKNTARSEASKVFSSPEVKTYLSSYQRRLADTNKITLDWLLAEYLDNLENCKKNKDTWGVKSNLDSIAKRCGFDIQLPKEKPIIATFKVYTGEEGTMHNLIDNTEAIIDTLITSATGNTTSTLDVLNQL